jgi:membrane-anchored protein YejM (alkaline phosphatase superfamily)
LNHSAYELVTDGRIRDALSLSEVSDSDRERYGRNKLGQSLLLAKRLSQAGVPWVGYNEFNQKWDTHGGLKGRYEQIVPPLDQAFTALIRDLKQEGLLDETIVVLAGEFGRTPKVNDGAGRDHWPNAYSIVMAGGGLQSGLVFGTTDNQGAEVLSDAVSPADVLATVWHLMGLDPQTTMYDRLERPHLVSSGRIRKELLS